MSDKTVTIQFEFELDPRFLDGLDDFGRGRRSGITVAEVAAAVVSHHKARHGYVHWSFVQPDRGPCLCPPEDHGEPWNVPPANPRCPYHGTDEAPDGVGAEPGFGRGKG